jgi:hypothetical protein
MKDSARLILNYDGLSKDIGNFYANLASSDALRELFIKDPVGVVLNSLSKQAVGLPDSLISLSNMLLLALLSNKQFVTWAREYGDKARQEITANHKGVKPAELEKLLIVNFDQRRVRRDLTDAMLKFIDAPILYALIAGNARKINSREFQVEPLAETLVSENILIATNAIAVANVIAVFNHVILGGTEIEAVSPKVSRNDLEVVARLVAEQMFAHANELRKKGLLASLDKFESEAG